MLKKTLLINLLLFVAYTVLISAGSSVANKGFNIAIGMGMCVFIQVMLNVLVGVGCLVVGKRDLGKSCLISAAVLIPIGFCAWLILLSIFG